MHKHIPLCMSLHEFALISLPFSFLFLDDVVENYQTKIFWPIVIKCFDFNFCFIQI